MNSEPRSIAQPNSSDESVRVTNVQIDSLELERAMCEQWSVSKLKQMRLSQLNDCQRASLKTSRPTPELSLSQECQSRGKQVYIIRALGRYKCFVYCNLIYLNALTVNGE